MREPDKTGSAGRAWVRGVKRTKAHEAIILDYIVNCPGVHPLRTWWGVSLVHLRDIEGVPPAEKRYPEAEYEFLIIALDLKANPTPSPDDWCFSFIYPPDILKQFHGIIDEEAKRICNETVQYIIDGEISPDQDYREVWKKFIKSKLNKSKGGDT